MYLPVLTPTQYPAVQRQRGQHRRVGEVVELALEVLVRREGYGQDSQQGRWRCWYDILARFGQLQIVELVHLNDLRTRKKALSRYLRCWCGGRSMGANHNLGAEHAGMTS